MYAFEGAILFWYMDEHIIWHIRHPVHKSSFMIISTKSGFAKNIHFKISIN
jgi:hypothetical protein